MLFELFNHNDSGCVSAGFIVCVSAGGNIGSWSI